jgi:uncharacterized protein YggE
MKKISLAALAIVAIGCFSNASAQDVQVSPTNRTIAVTASETLRLDPDLTIAHVGYHNYGPTKEATYTENVRAAEKITKALFAAGVPKESLETEALLLSLVDYGNCDLSSAEMKNQKFEALQTWQIRLPVPDAQKIVDVAVAAGATDVNPVQWVMADVHAPEAKASSAALAKARIAAEQIANQMAVKLGALSYVTNGQPLDMDFTVRSRYLQTVEVTGEAQPSLILYPHKVEKTGTVSAVFAIE